MKKFIILPIIALFATFNLSAQCSLPFPQKNWAKSEVILKPEIRSIITFPGRTKSDEAFGLVMLIKSDNKVKMTESHFMNCKGANDRLNTTRPKMINYELDSLGNGFTYYISEFVDTLSRQVFAIEYRNSKFDSGTEQKKISFLLPTDRVDGYASFHKSGNTTESNVYTDAKGGYLYDIYDGNELCGIRYKSDTDGKEYKMYFK